MRHSGYLRILFSYVPGKQGFTILVKKYCNNGVFFYWLYLKYFYVFSVETVTTFQIDNSFSWQENKRIFIYVDTYIMYTE